ncbi:MAG: hypothetical protein WC317_00555 [Candidatus Omnitrophota bacterium]|jgi:hypothetical protein
MQSFILCIIGYVAYLFLSSIVFIADVLAGQGGSGKIFQKFWLPVILLVSILIFVGTAGYLFKNFSKINKLVSIILSMLATLFQIGVLMLVFFHLALRILAPILIKHGFYVTMP